MKTQLFLALLATATLLGGCDKKEEGGEKTETTAAKAAGGDADIPKICNDYLSKFEACFKDMPAAAKAPLEQAMQANKDAIKNANTPEAKKALETTCKAWVDALDQNPACKK
jgi:hypothetical protein